MMKGCNRIYIFFGFGLLSLGSCDNSKDLLVGLNEAPRFTSNGETKTLISDSLKLSQVGYDFKVSLIDANENVARFTYELDPIFGQMFVNGVLVPDNDLPVNNLEDMNLQFRPGGPGRNTVTFVGTDEFGESGGLTVEVLAFSNLRPVAIAVSTRPEGAGPNERLLDASGSFDRDEKFGGRIVRYEYIFLGIVVGSDESSQTVIFPDVGNYTVNVRVLDNDNVWSTPVGLNISI